MTEEKNKISKKKIDAEMGQALFSDTERFEMWFAAYWKPAAIAAAVIAVLTALVFWAVTAKNNADKKAAFALADANTAEELSAALKAYDGHPGTVMARYRLAKILMDSEKYQEAAKELDKISTEDAVLSAKAKLAAAYAAELSGDTKGAISRFLAVENTMQFSAAARAEAGYSAGRLLIKAKDLKQAKAVLGRTALLGSGSAAVGYWTENAKQTLIAIDNGEYAAPKAAPKALPARKKAAKAAK
ncbi:MAG: hypothetical protein IKC65_02250 [Lentisphaeria bacterium]|nr:hypothetical protein [Lentisphaeria bacterium]